MNNAEVLIKFKGDTSDADKSMSKAETSIGKLAKSFTLANLAAQGVTKAIQVFNQNLDSAIRRVDTMNNFPKVMSNLGISAEASAEVIDDLGKKLQGLPTSLDAAAMSVQRLTSKNGDVKKSEQLFLALNNAILAGGGSAEIQANALEQISQAYAKGKPDMMEWRTLMTAMPAQLKQVAQAMGYTDAAMLGEAVRAKDGEKVFAQMMDTMMKMNTEGVNGFKSFEEQARNATGGISTSVTNMKTAIVRGIASMLNSLNKALEPFGGISGVLNKIGKAGEKVFTAIGKAIAKVIPYMVDFGKWIKKNETWLKPLVVMVATFVATFKTIKTVVTIIKTVKTAFAALNAVMLANPITLIIAGIAALVAGFVYLWNHCEAFKNFWINMWNGIKNIFSTIVNFVKENWKGLLLFLVNPLAGAFKLIYDNCEGFRNFINNFVGNVISFIKKIPDYLSYAIGYIVGLVTGLIARLWEFITSDIPNFFVEVLNKIAQFFINIGTALWNFITVTIPNFIKNVINKLKELPGKVWEVVKEAPGKIAKAFIDGIQSVKDAVAKIFNAIWDGLKDLPNKMLELGKDIVKGIWNGIKSMGTWLKDKIKGFGKGVVDGMKSAFKIGSPSKLMAQEVGQWIPKGIAVGIEANTNSLNRTLSDVASMVTTEINSSINPSLTGSMQNNITPVTNVYVSQKQDPLGRMVQEIKTFSGGAKQDYLYGR